VRESRTSAEGVSDLHAQRDFDALYSFQDQQAQSTVEVDELGGVPDRRARSIVG